MNDQNRLCYVITSLSFAGAQAQMLSLVRGMRDRGWTITVAYMVEGPGWAPELRDMGIDVRCLAMKRGLPDPRAVIRLAAAWQRWKPVVVHSHMIHANILSRVARLVAKVPVHISTAHNVVEGPPVLDIISRLTSSLTDLHTCVCQAGVERMIRRRVVPGRKALYVPNGLDTKYFRPDGTDRAQTRSALGVNGEFVWLAVGRLETVKAFPLLIDAFAALRDADGSPTLLIVGEGPAEQSLREQVRVLGLGERVRFLGVRRDMPQLMNASDAVAMSSFMEGLPMVLLEASACGIPVVATDVGGNREVVLDGTTGLLTAPGDSKALTRAMRRIMALSEDQRRSMGAAGRMHVTGKYAMEDVIQRWATIYDSLLAGRERPGEGRQHSSGTRQ